MTRYQKIIKTIDPVLNARWVEGFMRLQYKTLDHLSKADFEREVNLYKEEFRIEDAELLEENARSYGL